MDASVIISCLALLASIASVLWAIISGRRSNKIAREALQLAKKKREEDIEAVRPILQIRPEPHRRLPVNTSDVDGLYVENVGGGPALNVILKTEWVDISKRYEELWNDSFTAINEDWAKGNRTIEPSHLEFLFHTYHPLEYLRVEAHCIDSYGNQYVYKGDQGRLQLVRMIPKLT